LGPFPLGGSPESIFAVHAQTPPPFEPGVGPALSFAIDMASPDHPRIGLAGGESGHPGSPHFRDALDDWLAGRARPLWLEWADVTYHAVGSWELEPLRR
jgi:penicillin amidase